MKRIFFIGISGIGMSGLAKIMCEQGYEVLGSDLKRSYATDELEEMGIKIFIGHDEGNIEGADLVVRSSAIKQGNPEYERAVRDGIEVIKRGELLALLMNREEGIAVAGTHGKTTTSSMLGAAMLSVDPTIVVGGIVPEIGSNAQGGRSGIFIAEADESDNSFLYLNSSEAIITNIEADHLENHGSYENIERSFVEFMEKTKNEIVVNIDCENVRKIIGENQKVTTYGIENREAHIVGRNLRVKDGMSCYDVHIGGELIGEFSLGVPGDHNISNSLPVIYLALKHGVEVERVREALKKFKGAKRRYDVLYDKEIKIVDDYAHHPTEIKATLQGAKSVEENKIVAIFQPHRYSRLKFLLNEFKGVFKGADEVVIMPVFAAGEKDEFGVTLEDLLEVSEHNNIRIERDEKSIEDYVAEKNQDITYLFMGAGSISALAHRVAEKRKG